MIRKVSFIILDLTCKHKSEVKIVKTTIFVPSLSVFDPQLTPMLSELEALEAISKV